MTRFRPIPAAALAALLGSAAIAQDTRGVRIIDPSQEAPAPAPEPTPTPTPKATPKPVPRPTSTPAPRPASTPSATPAAQPAPPPRPAAACVRAFPEADFKFTDGASSRRRLAELLRPRPARVVLDVAPFASEKPSAGLAPWLTEVRAGGGEVSEKDIRCTRGFSFGRLFKSLFGARDPNQDFATIRGYDAVLWVDTGEGLVRQVELLKRDQP